MGNKIITNFSIFNESEAYVFEDSKIQLMTPIEKTLIEIMERQKKYNRGKDAKPESQAYKSWKQRQDSLEVYNSIDSDEKSKILDAVKKEFERIRITETKYKAVIEQESDRDSQNTMYQKPFIIVTKENIETFVPGDKKNPESPVESEKPNEFKGTVDLIPQEIEGSVFKDNKWENKAESYTNPVVLEELKKTFDALQDLIKLDIKSGGMLIKKIDILSSASRLRNTGDENLSWLELGKKRSETLALAIGERSKSIEGADDKDLELIRKKISLDYFGSNGDGTSGPDPLPPYKRGYYKADGTFKDEQNGQLRGKKTLDVLIVRYDDSGKQQGVPKLLKAKDLQGKDMADELKDNKIDYKQFQYNQITVTFNDSYTQPKKEVEGGEDENSKVTTPPVISETQNVKFSIGLKGSTWKKPPMKIDTPDFKKMSHKMDKAFKKMFKMSNHKPFRSVACPSW